jgi:hypothetical protein
MDKEDRQRFDEWRHRGRPAPRPTRAHVAPIAPMPLKVARIPSKITSMAEHLIEDSVPGRPPLCSKRGVWRMEEMHVRDETGAPLGTLRLRLPYGRLLQPRWLNELSVCVAPPV